MIIPDRSLRSLEELEEVLETMEDSARGKPSPLYVRDELLRSAAVEGREWPLRNCDAMHVSLNHEDA